MTVKRAGCDFQSKGQEVKQSISIPRDFLPLMALDPHTHEKDAGR